MYKFGRGRNFKLKLITISVQLDISGVHASPAALQTLTESLSKLKSIAYREMRTPNERSFWYLFKNSGRSLKYVDLRGCYRLRGRCFTLFGIELEEVGDLAIDL